MTQPPRSRPAPSPLGPGVGRPAPAGLPTPVAPNTRAAPAGRTQQLILKRVLKGLAAQGLASHPARHGAGSAIWQPPVAAAQPPVTGHGRQRGRRHRRLALPLERGAQMRVRAPGGVRYRLRRAGWQAARRRGIERRAPCRPVEGGHRLPGLLPDLVTDSFFIAFGSGIAAVTRALMSTEVASQSKCQSPDISTIASLRTARKHLEASYTSGVASAGTTTAVSPSQRRTRCRTPNLRSCPAGCPRRRAPWR